MLADVNKTGQLLDVEINIFVKFTSHSKAGIHNRPDYCASF